MTDLLGCKSKELELLGEREAVQGALGKGLDNLTHSMKIMYKNYLPLHCNMD